MFLYRTIIRIQGFFTFICTERKMCEFIDFIKIIGYSVLYESHCFCYFIYINRIGSKSVCSLWQVVDIFSRYHMIEFLFNIERMILICGNRGSWNKNYSITNRSIQLIETKVHLLLDTFCIRRKACRRSLLIFPFFYFLFSCFINIIIDDSRFRMSRLMFLMMLFY